MWPAGLEAPLGLRTATLHTQTTRRHPRDTLHKACLQRLSSGASRYGTGVQLRTAAIDAYPEI